MTKLTLVLQETKKHSGKYVVKGTEMEMYPTMYYLKKEYFPNKILPPVVNLTIEDASS